jgi:hypothetical protein
VIALRPYEDFAAMAVLGALDVSDRLEAEIVRGAAASHLALFADWRGMEAFREGSWVAVSGPAATPFAVFGLARTGQAGVAAAALLARDHARWRRALARLAILLRREAPAWCAARGIRRIEARAWAGHPTATVLLDALGFTREGDMPGFGGSFWPGAVFRQFALTFPASNEE